MTIILAVDPGGTSGWASAVVDKTMPVLTRSSLSYGQLDPSGMADKLRQFTRLAQEPIGRAHEHVLVMERFTITPQTGKLSAQHDALELIGLSRYLAEWHGVEFDLSQSPGDAKGFAPNQKLKEWGVWVPVQDHARDAVRHLCLAAAKRGVLLSTP